jgi:uncharacterized protein (DUF433 family)
MFGKPVIKGTRISVEQILRKLAAGLTPEQILTDHPRLVIQDILAAEAFAADYLGDEDVEGVALRLRQTANGKRQ